MLSFNKALKTLKNMFPELMRILVHYAPVYPNVYVISKERQINIKKTASMLRMTQFGKKKYMLYLKRFAR
jgi:ArsR family metal-binding transcriptional regulator